MGDEQVVQPAGAGQSDFVSRVEHARGIAQQLAGAVERERLQKSFRRQPGPAPEQVVQFGRRHACGFGDGVDLGLLAPMAADDGRWRGARRRNRRLAQRSSCSGSVTRSGDSMGASIICSRSRRGGRGKPPDFCREQRQRPLFHHRPGRPALGFAQGVRQRCCETRLLARAQEGGDRQPAAARHQEQPLDAEFLMRDALEPHPQRIERPLAHPPRWLTCRTVNSDAVTVTSS